MRRRLAIIAAVFGAAGAGVGARGCVSIDGGSVEAPWALFAADGRAIGDCRCADPPVAHMRMKLVSRADGTDPCANLATCVFPCGRKIGATPFVIPEGSYLMSLVPLDDDGGELPLESTAPLLRDVVRGQVTELEASMFLAACSATCGGESADRPCSP